MICMLVKYRCDWCDKEFERQACYMKGKKHVFCSRQCLADFSSKTKNPEGYASLKDLTGVSQHMTRLNQEMNLERMTPETRAKMREVRLGRGECRGYSKIYGRPAHRVVMEQMLGRPLKPKEVVHHRDFNPYNNAPENLQLFASSAEHTRFHAEYRWFLKQLELLEAEENAAE